MSTSSPPPTKRQKRTHDYEDDSDKENDMMGANNVEKEEMPAVAVTATTSAGDGKGGRKEDAIKTDGSVVKEEEDPAPIAVAVAATARGQAPRLNLTHPTPAGVAVRIGPSSVTASGRKAIVKPNMIMDARKVAEDLEMAILNAQITEAAKELCEALATAKTAAKRQEIRRWELYRVQYAGGHRGLKGREARLVWRETISWLQHGLEVGQIEDKYGWGLWN